MSSVSWMVPTQLARAGPRRLMGCSAGAARKCRRWSRPHAGRRGRRRTRRGLDGLCSVRRRWSRRMCTTCARLLHVLAERGLGLHQVGDGRPVRRAGTAPGGDVVAPARESVVSADGQLDAVGCRLDQFQAQARNDMVQDLVVKTCGWRGDKLFCTDACSRPRGRAGALAERRAAAEHAREQVVAVIIARSGCATGLCSRRWRRPARGSAGAGRRHEDVVAWKSADRDPRAGRTCCVGRGARAC